jgi:dinuclear metal center YbgI/SA1388 family protein
VHRRELAGFLDALLEASRFRDYCPNGLQVEGRPTIRRIVSGVTASEALIRAAVAARADALLVHHGYFWRGEDPRVVGTRRTRLKRLLDQDLNLFAYHLPLDVHPEFGNNAQLARVLGWRVDGRFGEDGLGCWCDLDRPSGAASLASRLARRLGRRPLAVGATARTVRRVAWCTGAAQDLLEQAIDAGADAFVSGEISERTTHLAREAGVVYLAAGHHATERYGVQALAAHVAGHFGLEHRFVDDPNPA